MGSLVAFEGVPSAANCAAAKADLQSNKLGQRATVRPGLLAKLLEASFSPLFRFARVYAPGRVMAGMTAPA